MPSSRRRRRRRFLSNFKWPEDPLNLVEIKNPFGSFQTNPKADAWWVPPFFLKKCFCETPYGLSVRPVDLNLLTSFFWCSRLLPPDIFSSFLRLAILKKTPTFFPVSCRHRHTSPAILKSLFQPLSFNSFAPFTKSSFFANMFPLSS